MIKKSCLNDLRQLFYLLRNMSEKRKVDLEIVVLELGTIHLVVSAAVKEMEPLWWILDTGAAKSVIDKSLAEKCILEERDGVLATGLGKEMVETRSGMLAGFRIGEYNFDPLEVAIVDLQHVNEEYARYSDKSIAGLLGSDFFFREKAVIDFANKIMTL